MSLHLNANQQNQGRKRVAIYARYSMDQQRPTSIKDQIRNCREAAARNGWEVVDEFIRFDEAKSGQSIVGREGLEELLALAQQPHPGFDGILVDDTSRFGRNLSDTLPMTDVLKYVGVFIYFVNRSLDSRDPNFRTLFIFCGQQDENFSVGVAEKVHRGMCGRVLDGYIATGQNYGYTNIPVEDPTRKGRHGGPFIIHVDRVINPVQALVVVRIFEMSAGGAGSRLIAATLNVEGVPSPLQGGKGWRVWCSRTITNLLTNEKHIGIHIWNRTHVVRNPITGRKEQPGRLPAEWIRVEKPEWRIISDELWAAKEASLALRREKHDRAQAGGNNRTGASRAYVFSNRIICDPCNGKYVVTSSAGERARYGCYSHRNRGASICPNSATIFVHELQSQLIAALVENLRDPRVWEHLSVAFHRQVGAALEERRRTARQLHGKEAEMKGRLSELNSEEKNIADAIAKMGFLPVLQVRLDSIQFEKQTVEDLLAKAEEVVEVVPSPGEIETFLRGKMEELAQVLLGDPIRAKQEIQKRVKELRLRPIHTPDGITFEVTGDVSLFSGTDGVMQGTSRTGSSRHYTSCVLPFQTIILQNPGRATARALKRAA
jgi:DNA invertase Pin-like site-specific DNA recombinase/vacuolar-type H+-ATPase subunit E/Vma4